MGEPGAKRGKGRWVAMVVLVAAGILLLRMLGPGGPWGREPVPPVAGRILRPDGKPVAGAVVEATFETGAGAKPVDLRSAPTSAEGRFEFPGAPEKWTSLRIRTRCGPLAIDADLADAPAPLDLNLGLPATFTVAGIVVSTEVGRPLPEMDVRLGYRKARTDDLGRFSFPDLPASMANIEAPVLEVSGKGRKTWKRPISWEDGVDDILVRLDLP